MLRHLALFLLAATTPLSAAAPLRSFTVTSFDRIRVEGPYAVTLSVGRSPFARAEGSAAALDRIDLRVEGRTMIIRQRSVATSGQGSASGPPVRIALGTPDLRVASLSGAGSLAIDRLRGLSIDVAVSGPGRLTVATIEADRLFAAVQGSGGLTLAGRVKSASLTASGAPVLAAAALIAEEAKISAEGAAEVTATVRSRATVFAAGTGIVRLSGQPTCVQRLSGSATIEGCAGGR